MRKDVYLLASFKGVHYRGSSSSSKMVIMRIDELYLKNFRNVEEERYYFPNQFTVVIGMNGAGKSTILRGLRVVVGAYLLGIPKSKVKNAAIEKEEVRKTNTKIELDHYPVVVRAKGSFPERKEPLSWQRRIARKGGSTTFSKQDVGEVRAIGAEKYAKMMKEGTDELNLPIIAYFGTNRVFGTARKRSRPRVGRKIFEEGYHNWSDMRASTYQFERWLATYDIMVKDGKEYASSKQVFFDAIRTACPYVQEVRYAAGALWLRTHIDGKDSDLLPIHLHSDGVITFVKLVAELAFRCIVLNGYLEEEAVRGSRGVVLIDELDLHLHPKWQKHVVRDLKAAFPNIQFIVTSHSPIIVQSLSAEELINLDRLSDVHPNDLSVETVVTQLMGLSSVFSQENTEAEQLSETYLSMLKDKPLSEIVEALDGLESDISDPAVRAFLKMKRLEKETKG